MNADAPFADPAAPPRPPACVKAPLLAFLAGLVVALLPGNLTGPGAAVAGLFLFLLLRAGRRRFPMPLAPLATAAAGAAAGGFLALRISASPAPDWSWLPPREVTFTVRVEEVFHARKEARVAGVGRIVDDNSPRKELRGRRLSFYLATREEAPPPLARGETLRAKARLGFLPAVKEPDGFQSYLLQRDIFLAASQGTVLARPRDEPASERIRQLVYRSFQDRLTAGCTNPADPGYVLASMLLGNRGLLTDERIVLYKHTGSFHLFAVSGLHVGGVVLTLHLLLRWLRFPERLRFLPLLVGLWFYVWLTGGAPSAVRSGIMLSCVLGSRYLLRQPHLFPALVFSAFLVLLWNPRQLYALGFQLSYGVVASILLLGLPLAEELNRRWERHFPQEPGLGPWREKRRNFRRGLVQLLCVSAGASLASAPLIAQHFALFTPGGWLVAPLLNPLAAVAVFNGVLLFLAAPLPTEVLALLARPGWWTVEAMEGLLALCLHIPGGVGTKTWPWPPTGTLLLAAALAIAWLLQRHRQEGHELPLHGFLLPYAFLFGSLFTGLVHP